MARLLFAALVLAAVASCDPPPVETQVGDACDSDDKCDKGFVCLDEGDGAGACQELPADCEPIDGCDCEALDDLCPEAAFGNVCVAFGSKINVECELPAEGEGEGEGE